MFVYPTPQYPRRPLEYVFKALYNLVGTVHIVSLVVLISDFYTRLKVSMPEYYTNSDLVLAPGIVTVLDGCTYRGPLRLGNVRATVDVSLGSIPYALMTTAQYITGLFVVEFLFIVNNFVCLFNYTTGNRHLRLCGVHVPFYHITVTFAFVYSLTLVVLTWSFDVNRRFYERGLQYCADDLRTRNTTRLLESEYVGGTIFSTAVYWPFAAACFGAAVYLAGAIALAVRSSDRAAVLLSEADAPWEARGPLCTTSKPLLRLHTAQRNRIIDDAHRAMADGERVRIVRSYHLMTDDDFDKLVQAMREQVAQLTKEAQFERLRENFGDRVSQIDEGSFVWRHDLPSAPPSPDAMSSAAAAAAAMTALDEETAAASGGERLVDVDFDAYFDGHPHHRRPQQQHAGDAGSGGMPDKQPHTSSSGVVLGELSPQPSLSSSSPLQQPPPPPPPPRPRRRHAPRVGGAAIDGSTTASQLFAVYSDHESSVRVADGLDDDDDNNALDEHDHPQTRRRRRGHRHGDDDGGGTPRGVDEGRDSARRRRRRSRRAHDTQSPRHRPPPQQPARAPPPPQRAVVEDEDVPADALSDASMPGDDANARRMLYTKPTLSECFPDVLTRQWPSTANPVTCECRQLYVLVALCCCVPRTHLLVLHDVQRGHAVTSMPKGPKYVDYTITSRTTVEGLCAFLQRAEAASSSSSLSTSTTTTTTTATTPPTTAAAAAGGDGARYSPASVTTLANATSSSSSARRRVSLESSGAAACSPHDVDLSSSPPQPRHGQRRPHRVVVVVCLYGLAAASPAVQSALMDVLTLAQVPTGDGGAEAVPSLRVVAFCNYRFYATLLPPALRAAFALSTFMSTLAMDSAAVLQNRNYLTSSVVNKTNMIAAMHARDGLARSATVTLAPAVARYLHHVVLVVCGSLCPTSVVGAQLLQRLPHMRALLRVAALLFMPDDVRDLPLPPHLRYASTSSSSSSYTVQAQQQQQQQQRYNALHVDDDDDDVVRDGRSAVATTATQRSRPHSFAYVVVSPSDVLGLLPSFLTHVLTLSRDVALPSDVLAAMRESALTTLASTSATTGGGGGAAAAAASLSVEHAAATSLHNNNNNNSSHDEHNHETTTTTTAIEHSLWDVLVTSRAALSFASRRSWSNASAVAATAAAAANAAAAAAGSRRETRWRSSDDELRNARFATATMAAATTTRPAGVSVAPTRYTDHASLRGDMAANTAMTATTAMAAANNNNNNNNNDNNNDNNISNNNNNSNNNVTAGSFAPTDLSLLPDMSMQLSMLSAHEVLAALAQQQQQQQQAARLAAAAAAATSTAAVVPQPTTTQAAATAAAATAAHASLTPRTTSVNSPASSPATVALRVPSLAAVAAASRASLTGLLHYCEVREVAVYGHDTTFVRRMSLAEYVAELRSEATSQIQQQQPLRSNDDDNSNSCGDVPNDSAATDVTTGGVTFTCRFPLHDRLGRPLCVLYQAQDTAVSDELRRLRRDDGACDAAARRPGVRLSHEIALDNDNNNNDKAALLSQTRRACDDNASRKRGRGPACEHNDDSDSDSDSDSGCASSFVVDDGASACVRAAMPLLSGDACNDTLYRDSEGTVCGTRQAHDATRDDNNNNHNSRLVHTSLLRARSAPAQSRACRLVTAPVHEHTSTATCTDKENVRVGNNNNNNNNSSCGCRCANATGKPAAQSALRSASAPRTHRVYFADYHHNNNTALHTHNPCCPRGDGDDKRDATPPPPPLQQLLRATTTLRESMLRTTKQLFRDTHGGDDDAARVACATATREHVTHDAMTTTAAAMAVRRAHDGDQDATTTTATASLSSAATRVAGIGSSDYGAHAATIAAHKVSARIEALWAARYGACSEKHDCGDHDGTTAIVDATSRLPAHGAVVDCVETSAPELRCGDVVQLGRRRYALRHFCATAEVYIATDVTTTAFAASSDDDACDTDMTPQQVLLYRWHRSALSPHDAHARETWRAAAGVAAACAAAASSSSSSSSSLAVRVYGYRFADGAGVTLCALPRGYAAVCVRALSLLLDAPAYTTLLKTLTRMLAALAARRLVHGSLHSLDMLFLALPTTTTRTDAAAAATASPLLVPVHWERCVDFGMFVDRNAGRTLPYDSEDNTHTPSLLTLGSDVLTLLPCMLQHRQSRELTARQHTLLQQLTVMAAQPAPVAHLLVHMTDMMHALPSDAAALRRAFDVAVAATLTAMTTTATM